MSPFPTWRGESGDVPSSPYSPYEHPITDVILSEAKDLARIGSALVLKDQTCTASAPVAVQAFDLADDRRLTTDDWTAIPPSILEHTLSTCRSLDMRRPGSIRRLSGFAGVSEAGACTRNPERSEGPVFVQRGTSRLSPYFLGSSSVRVDRDHPQTE
jgi:hypothetical protein